MHACEIDVPSSPDLVIIIIPNLASLHEVIAIQLYIIAIAIVVDMIYSKYNMIPCFL